METTFPHTHVRAARKMLSGEEQRHSAGTRAGCPLAVVAGEALTLLFGLRHPSSRG